MKKLIAFMAALALICALCACGGGQSAPVDAGGGVQTPPQDTQVPEDSSEKENSQETAPAPEENEGEPAETAPAPAELPTENNVEPVETTPPAHQADVSDAESQTEAPAPAPSVTPAAEE